MYTNGMLCVPSSATRMRNAKHVRMTGGEGVNFIHFARIASGINVHTNHAVRIAGGEHVHVIHAV